MTSEPFVHIADRHHVAYSWWLASRLARRHPDLRIVELHPGGGQYDSLALLDQAEQTPLIINRGGSVHFMLSGAPSVPLTELVGQAEPHRWLLEVERAAGLPQPRQPAPATARTITYRVAAQLTMSTSLSRRPFDVRSSYHDTSGGTPGSTRLLEHFPVAAERALVPRPDDPFGIAEHRYWVVVADDRPHAALDTGGHLYHGAQVIDLTSQYAAHGRSIGRLLAAVVPRLVP